MATTHPRRVTGKVRELVSTERRNAPPPRRLTPAQADLLTSIALRSEEFSEPVSSFRAINALAVGRPDAALPVLARILADRGAPPSDRVAAARGLALLDDDAARSALRKHVREPAPRVQQAIVAALGEIGDVQAARALGKLDDPADPAARQQLHFARALLAHRHGLDGPFLPESRTIRRRQAGEANRAALTLKLKPARATAADLRTLQGPTYGVTFSNRALALSCGTRQWTVFVNADLGPTATQPTHLFERPWIVAVLGWRDPERRVATTQYVVLSRPTAEGAHLDVVRGDGRIICAGTAQPVATDVEFTLSDVDQPATAPLLMRGTLTAKGVDLDTAVATTSRRSARTTKVI